MSIKSLHISAILYKQFLFHIDFRLKFTDASQKLQNQNKNETACALIHYRVQTVSFALFNFSIFWSSSEKKQRFYSAG